MKENLIDYDSLPMRSAWDGSSIRRTINCASCEYLVCVLRDRENLEICVWGVAWKILSEVEEPGKCFKIARKSPKYSSLYDIQ